MLLQEFHDLRVLGQHRLSLFGERAGGEDAVRGGGRVGEVAAVELAEDSIHLAVGRLRHPRIAQLLLLCGEHQTACLRRTIVFQRLDHFLVV